MADDVRNQRVDSRRVAHIAGHEPTRPVAGMAAADHDLVAVLREGFSDPATKSPGTAGDEDDAVQDDTMRSAANQPNAIAGVMHAPGPG